MSSSTSTSSGRCADERRLDGAHERAEAPAWPAPGAGIVNAAAWTCLVLPLASTVAITLGGTYISRRVAGYISTLTTMGAFAAAVVAFVKLLGESPAHRTHLTTSWTWLSAGRY